MCADILERQMLEKVSTLDVNYNISNIKLNNSNNNSNNTCMS